MHIGGWLGCSFWIMIMIDDDEDVRMENMLEHVEGTLICWQPVPFYVCECFSSPYWHWHSPLQIFFLNIVI